MLVLTEPTTSGPVRRASVHQDRAQRFDLNRIAERGSGAVRLDVADVSGTDAGALERVADHRLLRGTVRDRQAAAAAVLVDRGAANQREDAIAVAPARR